MALTLPAYDRINRQQIDAAERAAIGTEDVVVFEGTVALSLRDRVDPTLTGYFVETDEAFRRDRVLREYRLRGSSPDEADAIYRSRQVDETPIVLASAAKADQRVRLPLASFQSSNPS